MTPKFENHLFTAEQIQEIVLVRLKKNLIRQLTELDIKEELFKYLHKTRTDESVKVILIVENPEKIKGKEMIEFLGELSDPRADSNKIARVYNAINQLVLFVRGLDKFVIHVDSGNVLSLFLNFSLACDYRIIGDKTVFQYPTRELGLVPKGGGIFFLSRAIGKRKTLEIMLSGKNITALEALELGIVDKVVPADSIEMSCMEIAGEIAQHPLSFLCGVKKLLNFPSDNLASFLKDESNYFMECVKSNGFRERLEKH